MEINNCKCGCKPSFNDVDDFEHHTKTYRIICYKCGRRTEFVREIGKISPKKAIEKVITEWNTQQ